MSYVKHNIAEFYASPTGQMAHDFLRARIAKIFLRNEKSKTLIIGYGLPFADDVVAITGGQVFLAFSDEMPAAVWPHAEAHQVCCVDSGLLPFGDVTFDNVIAVHALEFAPDAARLMHEIQRVLVVEGRVLCIAPHRAGMWSWFDHTPLGEGQSFSHAQLRRLLLVAPLVPLEVTTALFPPPLDFSRHEILRGLARGLESIGHYLALPCGGAVIAAAQKQRYAGIGLEASARKLHVNLQWAAAHGTRLGTT